MKNRLDEMKNRNITRKRSKTPPQEIEMNTFGDKQITPKRLVSQPLSFRETLKNPDQQPIAPVKINKEICQNIFMNGSKNNKKYVYPSEFPKLTKIKPITVSIKRGGKKGKNKRKTRKIIKKYKKY